MNNNAEFNIRCNKCGSSDVISRKSSRRSGPPKNFKPTSGKLISWSKKCKYFCCDSCKHCWSIDMKEKMKKTDTWIAGSNRVDWFIENEMTDVRLEICIDGASLMTDEGKWKVVKHIADTLNSDN